MKSILTVIFLTLICFPNFAQEKKERVKREIGDDMYGNNDPRSPIKRKDKQEKDIYIPIKNGEVIYSDVVDVNLSKEELFNNLKNWFAMYFRSSNDVIQLENKEQGRIIGKALLKPTLSSFGQNRTSDLRISIQVDCKDDKYRYIITVIEYNHSHTSQTIPELVQILNGEKKTLTNNKSYAKKQLLGISDSIEEVISSLKSAMKIEDDF